ncbi:TniQ family protein [Ponticoccus alexandrii]|uniref:TniQ domain-containing protein n=1 Tax=Ponticoccus alexandrii TaxID=1943633 RepID=A0ABX7FDP2_9RHOB|nr:TniQ family protein [Ponticoccus alexandrii]QRF67793.1 hypothetical protein GQA70_16675 [Ponticoccus alexandrii]
MPDDDMHNVRLALTVSPLNGETPASIGSRLAARNGVRPRDLCSDMGMRWPFLCSGHPDQLALLADVGGLELPHLELWSAAQVRTGHYRVGRTKSSTGVFRRTSSRVCPTCTEEALAEMGRYGAHQLLEWNVLCLSGCARHKTALLDLPRAATSHETYDVVAQVDLHRDLVKQAADRQQVYEATEFETYVRGRIYRGPQDDWLSGLELTHLHGACMTLGAVICGAPLQHFSTYGQDQEREFCVEGLRVLSAGPESLLRCMEELKARSRSRRPYYSTDLGAFYHWLRAAHERPELQGIVVCVHAFAVRSYTMKPNRRVLGRPVPGVQRMSFDTARRQTGLGVALLKRLIGHVDGLSDTETEALTETTPEQLDRAIEFWGGLRNLKSTAAALNVLPTQVKGLIDKGVLRSIRFGTALRYVYAEEVDLLLADVAALPEAHGVGTYLMLRDHCRNHRIGLVRLITLWRDGKIEGLARVADVTGLQAILVPQEVDVGARDVPLAPGDLTPLEAAAYLKIGVGAIRALRDAGYLGHANCVNADTNHRHTLITRSSIRDFEARFLTLGQLATASKVAPIHLARRLDREGVPTVSCGGRHVRAYERSQFAAHGTSMRSSSHGR